ncbi:MAG: SDR family NAD(P)-dependent oxidoreductase, partial [Acidobacteriota bacterium]|nr:SDR family NAD(P)-dependent oxidoreductase [Acidobacteriota bacterium]
MPEEYIELPRNLFAGKTAIVTGSSRGVGRATALRLAEGGANVVINYLSSEEKAYEVVELCKKKSVDAIAVQGDVSKWSEASNIAKQALEQF